MCRLFSLLCFFILVGCNKPDAGADIAPANLVLETVVSTDGSGNVAFTATAENAVSFDFELGNGEIKTGTNGILNYQYTLAGTNTYPVTITAISSSGLTAKKTEDITVTVQNAAGLLWSEEFNNEGAPDQTKWGYDIGNGSGGWGNNEVQYYTTRTDNAVVGGGFLKIILKKENYQGSTYTSAKILTKGKFSFKYGTIEVRAKLPAGGGTWPAIWMLGDNHSIVGWPACGEIDIMEHVGNQLNKIYSTLHYGPSVAGHLQSGGTKYISNATTEFHVYKTEWSPSIIKFSVDDVPFYTFVNNSTLPFNQKFYIILNVAMGGNHGGAVDSNFSSGALEIDYVRVYK